MTLYVILLCGFLLSLAFMFVTSVGTLWWLQIYKSKYVVRTAFYLFLPAIGNDLYKKGWRRILNVFKKKKIQGDLVAYLLCRSAVFCLVFLFWCFFAGLSLCASLVRYSRKRVWIIIVVILKCYYLYFFSYLINSSLYVNFEYPPKWDIPYNEIKYSCQAVTAEVFLSFKFSICNIYSSRSNALNRNYYLTYIVNWQALAL